MYVVSDRFSIQNPKGKDAQALLLHVRSFRILDGREWFRARESSLGKVFSVQEWRPKVHSQSSLKHEKSHVCCWWYKFVILIRGRLGKWIPRAHQPASLV